MTVIVWGGFLALIGTLIAFDLGVLHRKPEVLTVRTALRRWSVWFTLALIFNVYVYFLYEYNWLGWGNTARTDLSGQDAAIQYLTGYLIELSLSVDNVFVIATIFQYMRIPDALQYRILVWGILGAIVLRGIMISAGVLLIASFDWVSYIFGAVLLLSAVRLLMLRDDGVTPEQSLILQVAGKLYPVSPKLDGGRFFTTMNGRRAATPALLTLFMVEWADVMFAVDSVPAIFAVTRDPFLVFTSNVFAILGLRTLYFVVSGMMEKFRFVKWSLVIILAFVGLKMIIENHLHLPPLLSLCVIVGVMGAGVLGSIWYERRNGASGTDSANSADRASIDQQR
jgi:tellurite resistance protein TerC